MKRSVLINLICSMVVTVILIIGVILTMILTGNLDLNKHKLVIASASHTMVYDGKTLVDGRWNLIEGELQEGHELSVSVTGSQTHVGMSENYVKAIITNENGEDVTNQYALEYRPGALQVKAREIVLLAESAMKRYDGTPLVCNDYIMQSSVALLPTDELHVTVEGSITDIGEEVNRVTAATVTSKANGEDVTRNYHIVSKNGKLVIYDENALVISSTPASKTYDGTPLSCQEYKILNGELQPGHTIEASNFAFLTNCGNIKNTFDVKILDASGNDVTSQYDIVKEEGTLSVTKVQLNISGKEVTGNYGTSSFVAPNNSFDVSGLPEGHKLIPEAGAVSGEVPAFWGSVNSIPLEIDGSKFYVLNADGEDVTGNFDFKAKDGTLSVLPPQGKVTYFYVKALSNSTQPLYLKQKSFGNYNPTTKSWESAPEYDFDETLLSSISSSYYLTSSCFAVNYAVPVQVEIDPVGGVFALPYYTTDDQQKQDSDHSIEGDVSQGSYVVQYFANNLYKKGQLGLDDSLSEAEADYYNNFVSKNYLTVDEETKSFLLEYAEKNNLKADSEDIVYEVASFLRNYWVSGLSYNMEYNRAVDNDENPIIAFLEEYKEGVCRHYAQAATLLYRTLGIPARYTVGFACENVTQNKRVAVTDKMAHAWVEVYLEGTGWVYVEVTGSSAEEVIGLTVATVSKSELYEEGKSLVPDSYYIKESDVWTNLTKKGYTAVVEYYGERTTPGTSKGGIKLFQIYDPKRTLVYEYVYEYENNKAEVKQGKDRFNIVFVNGTLQLYQAKISWSSENAYKVYGDNSWNVNLNEKYTYTILEGSLADGHEIRIKLSGADALGDLSQVPAGTFENTIEIMIVDTKNNDTLVTDLYKIESKSVGSLEVKPRQITIQVGSLTVPYNGEEQFYDESLAKASGTGTTVVGEEDIKFLADRGHSLDETSMVFVHSEATVPGQYRTQLLASYDAEAEKNRIVVIRDKDGVDVTDNYSFTIKTGLFIVEYKSQ